MGLLLSMDVGSENIHLVEGSFLKGTITVENQNLYQIPKSAFDSGALINEEAFTECMNDAINEMQIKTKDIVITINAAGAVIRDIDLPAAKPKEIDQMIKTELYQTYQVLKSDIIQYKLVEKLTGDNGQILNRYRAATIDEDIVRSYRQTALKLKLKPVAMDININSIDKLFSLEMMINGTLLDGAATMAIDMGAKSTTIYILSKGKPAFFRQIPIGASEIESILHDETYTAISEIKKFKEESFNFFSENEASKNYFNFLKKYFYNLNDEIRKIMGFYSSRFSNMSIEQIYLFGGGSSLAGLAEYWTSNFNIPVQQINDISRIKFKNQANSISVHNHLNAIGALIRY